MLTNIIGFISVRNGAWQVQKQHISSAVVEEKLGALQNSSKFYYSQFYQLRLFQQVS